ncbi:uncharacterized protein LOC108737370 [Agrilus planipennis]|uniref:Uncharacterized protein LOC108737370 n=1 Tax=Agrilus planipennis TaxID=224129 RepID=A0A1W4WP42_AGRPL|nr:uncharacterized protein LOC108737370 [Agrilus planipennis]
MAFTLPQVKELFSVSEKCKNVHKVNIVADFFDLNVRNEKNVEKILHNVNAFLNSNANREIGFTFLGLLIPHCPTSLLVENCVDWIKVCIPNQITKSLSQEQLFVIEVLLENCSNIQEFAKALTSGLLPKLIELILTNLNANKSLETSLGCLKHCLRKFPSTCLPLKNKISTALLKFLEFQSSDKIIQSAGSAYHFLQQVGGAGPESINHISNWLGQFQKLCTTAQSLFDLLFENITEYNTYPYNDEPFSFNEIPSSASLLTVMSVTSTRLKNTLLFLNSFLIESYPVAKHVPVPEILDVIRRGLSADCYKKTDNVEDLHLSYLLYQIQIQLLILLKSLLACLKQNILPQSFLITKLLVDCLSRGQSYRYFLNKSDFQVTVYNVLSYWISVSRSTFNLTLNDKFIDSVLRDIQPLKSTLTLTISPEFAKKSSKLKQRKVQEQLKSISNSPTRVYTENFKNVKEQVCINAIAAIRDLCSYTMLNNIKPQTVAKMYNTVIQTVLEIQEGKIISPYDNIQCQHAMYDLILSFFEQKYSSVLPPLYVALQIFRKGQSNKNISISSICYKANQVLENFCQPVCPTLYLGNILNTKEDENEELEVPLLDEVTETVCRAEHLQNDQERPGNEKVKILSVEIIRQSTEVESIIETNQNENNENKNITLDISVLDDKNSPELKSMSTEYDSDINLVLEENEDSFKCSNVDLEKEDSDECLQINVTDDDILIETPPTKRLKREEKSPEGFAEQPTVDELKKDESNVQENVDEDMLSSFVDDVVADV